MTGRPANDRAGNDGDDRPGTIDDQRDRAPASADSERERARSRRAHPSRQSRRGFLGGMAGMGVGVGTATPGPVLQEMETLLGQVDEADLPEEADGKDPHTVATFEAIIDAVVPNTTEEPITTDKVGEELDDVHQFGGLDSGMTGMCIDILNDFMSPEVPVPKVTNTGETVPLSQALAAILDTAASELLARGGNEDQPQPGRFGPAGGPFASLSREDRFRALYDVENRASQFGEVDDGEYSRTGSFVVALAVVFPPIVYYSDMNGYDDFIDNAPSEREFDPAKYTSAPAGYDTLLGWAQSGYPGITEGHDALLGYELDETFESTGDGRRRAGETPGGDVGRPAGSDAGSGGTSRGANVDGAGDGEATAGGSAGRDRDDPTAPEFPARLAEWLDGGGFR